jgi:hypothetical protein
MVTIGFGVFNKLNIAAEYVLVLTDMADITEGQIGGTADVSCLVP